MNRGVGEFLSLLIIKVKNGVSQKIQSPKVLL